MTTKLGADVTRPKTDRAADWPTVGMVALIVLFGLALRLWGIGWSLPDARHPLATYHPDELVNLAAAQKADIPHGQFDIEFYNYGAFYFYMASFAQTVARGYGAIPTPRAVDAAAGPEAAMVAAAPERAALFLVGRLVTALLGTATIVVIFALGRRLFGSRAGLIAAHFYALAPLAVVHSHFLTVDVPATFFVALALLAAARLLDLPTWREYALAAIWSGLAAATKYNAGLVLVAPVAAHFLNLSPGACRKHRAAQLVVLLCVAALTFLIACPGPWLNFGAFWDGTYPGSGVRYELFEHSRTGHGDLFTGTGPGWWYHLVVSLRFGLGLPLLLLAIGGLVLAATRRTKGDWLLLAFFLVYYGATGLSAVRFARYMIPLFPVLCVFAARLITGASERRPVRQLLAFAAVVASVLTVWMSIGYDAAMASRDPRDIAADLLERTAPQGASIAFATVPWFYSPPLSPGFGALAAPQRAAAAARATRFQLRAPAHDWDASVLTPSPDYVVISNLESAGTLDRLHRPAAVRFAAAIPPGYRVARIGHSGIAPIVGFGAGIVPEDLMYILPVITIYERPTGFNGR